MVKILSKPTNTSSFVLHNYIYLSMFEAALFDIDGTIVDNLPYHLLAWKALILKHGISFSEKDCEQLFGLSNMQIVKLIWGEFVSDELLNLLVTEKERLYQKLYAPHIKAINGLYFFLSTLINHGLQIVITSAAPPENRMWVLRKLRLEKLFKIIIGPEHTQTRKGDPQFFLSAANILGVAPEKCLVFEDAPHAIEAATLAQMKVIGILTSYSKEDLIAATHLIIDYTELSTI